MAVLVLLLQAGLPAQCSEGSLFADVLIQLQCPQRDKTHLKGPGFCDEPPRQVTKEAVQMN